MTAGMVDPEVGYGKDWWPTLNALEPIEVKRTSIAVEQFLRDPNHPSLNLHPLNGDASRTLYTIRATQELRILLVKRGNIYLLLEAGHHDDIYARAPRMQFVANPHTGFVDLVEPGRARDRALSRGSVTIGDDSPRPLDHWSDAELAEAGCSTDDVVAIRDCRTENDLCELPTELLELVVEIMELTPEQWRTPSNDTEGASESRLRFSLVEHGALSGFTKLLTPEQASAIVAAPIEDWMVFLHPDQRSVVTKRFTGPARVRGSAGTGKTVVALHRAAELAERYRADGGRILFTTFINSLPPVLAHLYERIPGTDVDEVDFVNVDKLASTLCRESGDNTPTDVGAINSAFAAAWKSVVTSGSPIDSSGLTRNYLREEITAVIKGRGLSVLDDYLDLERIGRSTRFTRPLREQAWALEERWADEMQRRSTVDFVDRVVLARDLAQTQRPRYRAAIIDEAQDITLVGLQLVQALVNGVAGTDQHDGLLIVGDGAQRIYPGGFTLRQAGVEVRGRTTVLRVNYRNTREVIDAAMAVTGAGDVDDLGDTYQRRDEHADALRDGIRPRLAIAASFHDELRFVADEINRLLADDALDYGDIAVALATNTRADAAFESLRLAGIPCQKLDRYDGTPTSAVKVGTHHRIKGLEFKIVFLPGLGAEDFPRRRGTGQDADEHAEYEARSLSQLFVAMTRARDLLYLTSTGDPADAIANALDNFDLVETDA